VTLLIGYASPEYAILASDRMATWTIPGNPPEKRYKEQITKTVFLGGQLLISFSGVADIGGNTEQWLLDKLIEYNTPEHRSTLTDHLVADIVGELIKSGRPLPDLWFSLLVVGYAADPQTGDMIPVLRTISNAKSQNYGEKRVGDFFWNFPLTVDTKGSDFSLWAVGDVPQPVERLLPITDAIRRYRNREPDRALEIARTMARVIVARSKERRSVGDTVQVAILPRPAVGRQQLNMPLARVEEPLTTVASFEFNSKEHDGFTLINGINVITDTVAISRPVVGPYEAGPIGPPEPFKLPPRNTN
jgi:hypothetical protein